MFGKKTKQVKARSLAEIVSGFRATIDELVRLKGENDARAQENYAEARMLLDEGKDLEREGGQAQAIADRLTALIGGEK